MSEKITEKIKRELLAIQSAASDRMLYAERVVAWARKNKKSALHKQFDWDDRNAANEYRLWQARRLVQIHINPFDGRPTVVSLSIDRSKGGGYRSVGDVISSRELSAIMLNDALAELERVRLRYNRVVELTSVWKAVARIRRRKSRIKQSLPRRKAA